MGEESRGDHGKKLKMARDLLVSITWRGQKSLPGWFKSEK